MTCFNCLFEDEAEYEEFYVNILMPDDEISYGNSEHFVKYSINWNKLKLYLKFKIIRLSLFN